MTQVLEFLVGRRFTSSVPIATRGASRIGDLGYAVTGLRSWPRGGETGRIEVDPESWTPA